MEVTPCAAQVSVPSHYLLGIRGWGHEAHDAGNSQVAREASPAVVKRIRGSRAADGMRNPSV